MPFHLTSPAFSDRRPIPRECSRNGGNRSPQLDWTDPPDGTGSFVLIMEDADAPMPAFRHWTIYDIPPDRRHLAPGNSSAAHAEGLPHAFNDFGDLGYDGPQPPSGDPPHTYRFRLAALDVRNLPVRARPSSGEVLDAARDHILAETELVGTFAPRA